MNAAIDVKHLLPAWEQFRAATDIAPIRDEAHYARMTEMLVALLDEIEGDELHPAMGNPRNSPITPSCVSAEQLLARLRLSQIAIY